MHEVRIYKPDKSGKLVHKRTVSAKAILERSDTKIKQAVADGRCKACGKRLPKLRHRRRLFCNDRCRDRHRPTRIRETGFDQCSPILEVAGSSDLPGQNHAGLRAGDWDRMV